MLGFLDELLRESRVEAEFVSLCMSNFIAGTKPGVERSAGALAAHQSHSKMALRTMLLKALLQEDYRGLSLLLAQSPLLRKFCGCDGFEVVKVPAKSTLQRYSLWLPHDGMRAVVDYLTRAALGTEAGACVLPGLEHALELDVLFIDSTCLPADIHFPVDWVLLRDATRTLVKAILWIRSHGLKNRIEEPEAFLSRINALCMAMAQAGKAFVSDSKNKRKAVLRKMKKVVSSVENHARLYRELLDTQWEATGISRGRVDAVLRRMDNIINQLPAAKKQAHERIIGERQVPNAEKILSLYDPDLHVMVRGKASGEVEFGNALLICEQSDGLIIDYQLTREAPRADVKCLEGSILRVEALGCGKAAAAVTDRGFESKANRELLEKHELINALCPRNPQELKRRAQEDIFAACQKRRAQTEARVAILKNVFIGERCRAKGFASRQAQVDWAVLSHNLRLLVRIRQRRKAQMPPAAAAA